MSEQMKNFYLEQLKRASRMNKEDGHIIADQVLVDIIKDFGLDEIVDAYNKIGKWYS